MSTSRSRDVVRVRDLVPTGEVVALIGPNGSGKSTLIKSLIGALRAGAGEIKWDGKPMQQWRRRRAGAARRVPRAVAAVRAGADGDRGAAAGAVAVLVDCSALESPRDEQIVREVAQRLGLDDILDRAAWTQISGGQRQRVFVGRALVQEPRAILLDEPNTFLDLKHQVELMPLLRTLAREQNVGVLMASHDLNLAAGGADRLVLLDRGAVVAGTRKRPTRETCCDVPMERCCAACTAVGRWSGIVRAGETPPVRMPVRFASR